MIIWFREQNDPLKNKTCQYNSIALLRQKKKKRQNVTQN